MTRVMLMLLLVGCGSSPGQSSWAGSGGVMAEGGTMMGGEGGILGEGGTIGGNVGSGGAPAPTWGTCDPTDPDACNGLGCVFDYGNGARCHPKPSGEVSPCAFWPCGQVQITSLGVTSTHMLGCPAETLCVPYPAAKPAVLSVVVEWGQNGAPNVQYQGSSICLATCVSTDKRVCDTTYFKACAASIPANAGYFTINGDLNRPMGMPLACPIPARR